MSGEHAIRTASHDSAEALAASGVLRVALITPLGKNGRGGIDRLNDDVIEALQASDGHVRATRVVTRGQGNLFEAQFVFLFALLQFLVLAMAGRIDVVHIHLSIRGSCYRKAMIGAAARLFRLPYVVHLHGIDFREFWAGAGPLLAGAIDKLFEGSSRIVVMGRFWSDVITERLPHVADRMVIIPNATPIPAVARTAAPDHRVRITFLGKVGARKGTPHLINALAALRKRPDWRAVIAGDGEVAEARVALQRHGLTDRVSVPGWLDLERRNALLSKTDILVLPSLAENLPMAVMEALAMGLAVVTTPVGAIPEVIENDRNGLLVPVGDEQALASALARLIGDTDLRARLGAAARRDIDERFDFGAYVQRMTAVWEAAARD